MAESGMTRDEIIKKYGYGVCDAFGDKHCVGKCYDPKDCGAKPVPAADIEARLRATAATKQEACARIADMHRVQSGKKEGAHAKSGQRAGARRASAAASMAGKIAAAIRALED